MPETRCGKDSAWGGFSFFAACPLGMNAINARIIVEHLTRRRLERTGLINGPKMSGTLAIIKTSGDPLVDIAGAYFPAWLACILLALLGTWIVHTIATRLGIPETLRPAALMLPCLFVAIACGFWLCLFSVR